MFYVINLDRMVSFYGETLGLKVIEETRLGNFVAFDVGERGSCSMPFLVRLPIRSKYRPRRRRAKNVRSS
jgi:catechol 2,3-dioxygenase-like lactoylglutathione lyase family enzyme